MSNVHRPNRHKPRDAASKSRPPREPTSDHRTMSTPEPKKTEARQPTSPDIGGRRAILSRLRPHGRRPAGKMPQDRALANPSHSPGLAVNTGNIPNTGGRLSPDDSMSSSSDECGLVGDDLDPVDNSRTALIDHIMRNFCASLDHKIAAAKATGLASTVKEEEEDNIKVAKRSNTTTQAHLSGTPGRELFETGTKSSLSRPAKRAAFRSSQPALGKTTAHAPDVGLSPQRTEAGDSSPVPTPASEAPKDRLDSPEPAPRKHRAIPETTATPSTLPPPPQRVVSTRRIYRQRRPRSRLPSASPSDSGSQAQSRAVSVTDDTASIDRPAQDWLASHGQGFPPPQPDFMTHQHSPARIVEIAACEYSQASPWMARRGRGGRSFDSVSPAADLIPMAPPGAVAPNIREPSSLYQDEEVYLDHLFVDHRPQDADAGVSNVGAAAQAATVASPLNVYAGQSVWESGNQPGYTHPASMMRSSLSQFIPGRQEISPNTPRVPEYVAPAEARLQEAFEGQVSQPMQAAAESKHRRERSVCDPNEEADGDGRRKKSKKVVQSTASPRERGNKKFACPYYKRNPKKYRKWTSCPGPGWDEVHRVKTHLYRRHPLPIQCPRCWTAFKMDGQLQAHLQHDPPCAMQRNRMPQEGFTKDQERKLRSRKKTHADMTDEDKWREIYAILFPDDDSSTIPSPYYCELEDEERRSFTGSGEFDDYATFVRREMPTLVRRELETLFREEFQDVEERVRPRIAQIVLDLQPRLLSLYKQSQTPLSEYGPQQRETAASGTGPAVTPISSRTADSAYGSGPYSTPGRASGVDAFRSGTTVQPGFPGSSLDTTWDSLYAQSQGQPDDASLGLDWDFDFDKLLSPTLFMPPSDTHVSQSLATNAR